MKMLRRISPVFLTLALIAIGLSFREPPKKKTFDEADFDSVVSDRVRTISPVELAVFIKNQTNTYWLVDLRDSSDFSAYHLPTSVNIDLKTVPSMPAQINDHIFLYTEFEREAVQAYELLIFRGYFNVHVVEGGIENWKREVLFPKTSAIPAADWPFRRELAEYFGGKLVDGESGGPQKIKSVDITKRQSKDGC